MESVMTVTDSQNIETADTAISHAFAKAGYTIPGIDPYDVESTHAMGGDFGPIGSD